MFRFFSWLNFLGVIFGVNKGKARLPYKKKTASPDAVFS